MHGVWGTFYIGVLRTSSTGLDTTAFTPGHEQKMVMKMTKMNHLCITTRTPKVESPSVTFGETHRGLRARICGQSAAASGARSPRRPHVVEVRSVYSSRKSRLMFPHVADSTGTCPGVQSSVQTMLPALEPWRVDQAT